MKITILDALALNPGDLSWKQMEKFGDVVVYETTDKEEVIERSLGSDILIVNKITFGEKEFEALKGLKYIGITATGFNIIDLESARKHGVTVTNVPSYSTDAVAESVFSFILSYAHRPVEQTDEVRKGKWCSSRSFTYLSYPLFEIAGKTLGIFGMGNIGRRVAEIAKAFRMNVIYTSRTRKSDVEAIGCEYVPLDTLLSESDFLTLHAPLTPDTENLINSETISKMKKSAMIINAARGPLVNEKDLSDALEDGRIAFAAIDVMSKEPPDDSKLFRAGNIYITPHTAWAPFETRKRLMDIVVDNLRSFLSGKPENVVS